MCLIFFEYVIGINETYVNLVFFLKEKMIGYLDVVIKSFKF